MLDFGPTPQLDLPTSMIVFDLSCDQAHRFEGWFGSAEDFAAQAKDGGIACPVCGSVEVQRQPSAPYLNTGGGERIAGSEVVSVANNAELLKKKFIEYVINNTEDVGRGFPEEARKIFYKEAPERAIRGIASGKEVSDLKEEGIEVMAVPGVPATSGKLH